MNVGQRLFLSVVPAILGVFTVAGLAYWGEYGRQAPHVLVLVGVAASVASLVMCWTNTRYVARRIQRLAGVDAKPVGGGGVTGLRGLADAVTGRAIATDTRDELDQIESTVQGLSEAVARAQTEGTERAARAEQRVQEYATLLADAMGDAIRQLDETRLPLHILLDNHFGDLNENQEEMLAAAQSAVEKADQRLRRLREIAELDRGTITLRRDSVRAGDLIASLLPGLNAEGQEMGVHVTADVEPALPRVRGDRARLQEACSLLLGERLRSLPPGSSVEITAAKGGDGVQIAVKHPGSMSGPPTDADAALSRRLIAAVGGRVEDKAGETVVTLPRSSGDVGTGGSLDSEGN
jgi:signal transduction histidine kinase